ncbi:MAG: hypothetical protein ACRDS9_22820, partial [Pseudonocardiaceae bacterium]
PASGVAQARRRQLLPRIWWRMTWMNTRESEQAHGPGNRPRGAHGSRNQSKHTASERGFTGADGTSSSAPAP